MLLHSGLVNVHHCMHNCLRRVAADLAPCAPQRLPRHSVTELELVAADGAGLGQRLLACFYLLFYGCALSDQTLSVHV